LGNLNKVFVVLVTVFSVMIVAVVVTFVANQDNLGNRLQAAKSRIGTLESTAKSAQDLREQLHSRFGAELIKLQQQLTEAGEKQSILNKERALLAADLIKERGLNEQRQIQHSQFMFDVGRLASMLDKFDKELSKMRSKVRDSTTEAITLNEQLMEVTAQAKALERARRNLQQENVRLAKLVQQYEEDLRLQGGLAGARPRKTPEHTPQDHPIYGLITATEPRDDETYAGVNVGSNDGVDKNMKFLISRDGQLVGTLVIDVVEERAAFGKVDLVVDEVAKGDRVISGE
jgi:hypothetical protein